MPTGKPGDHPLTDITVHQMEVFGAPCGDLIREISNHGGRSELERLDLYALDPRFGSRPDLVALESNLRRMRSQLPPH